MKIEIPKIYNTQEALAWLSKTPLPLDSPWQDVRHLFELVHLEMTKINNENVKLKEKLAELCKQKET